MSETLKCVSNEINKSSNSLDNTGMAFEMKMGFQYNIKYIVVICIVYNMYSILC